MDRSIVQERQASGSQPRTSPLDSWIGWPRMPVRVAALALFGTIPIQGSTAYNEESKMVDWCCCIVRSWWQTDRQNVVWLSAMIVTSQPPVHVPVEHHRISALASSYMGAETKYTSPFLGSLFQQAIFSFPNCKSFQLFWRVKIFQVWSSLCNKVITFNYH